jgi:hypothetical protein
VGTWEGNGVGDDEGIEVGTRVGALDTVGCKVCVGSGVG